MKPIVIIPTYNEKENIAAMLDKVMSLDVDFDVLVVDDNSPDGTADLVKAATIELSSNSLTRKRGKRMV